MSVAAGAWTRATGVGYYLGTYSLWSVDGDTLASPMVQAKANRDRVREVLATCGTLEVSFNGSQLGTIDTHAASTVLKATSYLPALPALTNGVVQVRSIGGSPVRVDGLAISRL